MGDILAPLTVLAEPVQAHGVELTGARFDRQHAPETNFALFRPVRTASEGPDHALLRLAPNQDFTNVLECARARLGWREARVQGLGSLIGVQFEDGQALHSVPSEFLITDAVVGIDDPPPEIVIVGADGGGIMSGSLSRGENAVLITAELILSRMG